MGCCAANDALPGNQYPGNFSSISPGYDTPTPNTS